MTFPVTAAVAAGADLLTGWMNNEAAEDRQNSAQNFSANQFATRYQTTVKDLMAAGLNPMLAYIQGGGSPPSSSAASSAGTPSIGRSITDAYNLDVERRRSESQIENIDANTSVQRAETWLKNAQTALAETSADQGRAIIAKLEAEAKKITEEIKNIPLEADRLRALTEQLKSSSDLLKAQAPTEAAKQAQLTWLAVKTMVEFDLLNLDYQAAEKLENFGREYGQFKPFVDTVLSLIRAFSRR